MPFAGSPSRLFGALAGQIALVFMLGLAPPQASAIRVLAESIPGAVPPEFAADLLIRVGDSAAAAREPAEWRADLYEQAFQLARSGTGSAAALRSTRSARAIAHQSDWTR